jgi:integrase
MAQAATLDAAQLQRVLDYLKTRRHYRRNKTMILLTQWSMLRVGEVAALRYCDVMDSDGQILNETVLAADQTKAIGADAFGLTSVCAQNWQRMWQHTSRNTKRRNFFTRSAVRALRQPRPHILSTASIAKQALLTHHHIRADAVD